MSVLAVAALLAVPGGCSRRGDAPPLQAAIEVGDTGSVARLLDGHVDVNATDDGGGTALHAAAHAGDSDLVRRLLDMGADPGVRDRDGDRPIDFAGSDEVRDRLDPGWRRGERR